MILNGNKYYLDFVHKKRVDSFLCVCAVCVTNVESWGWGIVSFCVPVGGEEKNWQITGGMPGGGGGGRMSTGRIEPYITPCCI